MLAAQVEVQVSLSPGVTVFSAIIAVFFTWLALSSDAFISRYIRRRKGRARRLAHQQREERTHTENNASIPTSSIQAISPMRGISEVAEVQPLLTEAEREHDDDEGISSQPREHLTNMKRNLNEACHLRAMAFDDTHLSRNGSESRPSTPQRSASDALTVTPRNLIAQATSNLASGEAVHKNHSERPPKVSSRRPSLLFWSRKWSSGQTTTRQGAGSNDLTDASSTSDKAYNYRAETSTSTSEGGDMTSGGTTPSTVTNSFVRSLPLTSREKSRLGAGFGLVASPTELILTLWGDCNIEAFAKSGIWAMGVFVISDFPQIQGLNS